MDGRRPCDGARRCKTLNLGGKSFRLLPLIRRYLREGEGKVDFFVRKKSKLNQSAPGVTIDDYTIHPFKITPDTKV